MPRYVVPHHGGLKYVRAIPKKLQTLEGRTVWTAYLKGLSAADAKTRALELAAEHDKRAKVLRNLPESDKKLLISKGGLARCQADAAQADYLSALLWCHTVGKPADTIAKQKQAIASLSETHAPVHNIVARIEGKPGVSPPRLFDLVTLHEKVNRLSRKTAERERTYVARFVEVAGDLSPQDVTREHVIAFRDALERQDLTTGNIKQHLAKLHTLFNVALSEGVVSLNPAHKIKARQQSRDTLAEDDKDFTSDHVRRIFAVLPDEAADFQWIVRLLAYHGARSKEICHLRCADVTTRQGVPVIRIHDKTGGGVKNKQSARDIPIHPRCKGIVAYAQKVAAEHGEGSWLFRTLKDSKAGREHGFQNYANGKFLRRKVGIKDRQPGRREHDQSIHSFRHTFSTLCREVGMPDSVKNALKGHTLGKGEGGKYGSAPSLKMRAKWIAKIDPLKG